MELSMLREKIALYGSRLTDSEEYLKELFGQKDQLYMEKKYCNIRGDSEEMIELWIKSIKLNIQIVDLRSEVILEKNKLKFAHCEMKSREECLEQKKKFLVSYIATSVQPSSGNFHGLL